MPKTHRNQSKSAVTTGISMNNKLAPFFRHLES